MREPTYPPARRAAPTLHERLEQLGAGMGREEGRQPAPLPGIEAIETLVDAGFWASLRREEGRSPKISLAFVPRERAGDALVFDRRIPLVPSALTRLAPAVERPGIHLGVWGELGDLHVWGATRMLPDLCFVLEVVEPGLAVAKYSRGETYGKFGNLAVFRGDRVKVVDESAARRPECPELLASLTSMTGSEGSLESTSALVQLALSMRAHGHGGTLLVVPTGSGWQRSIVSPIPYRVAPPFSRLAELVRRKPGDGGDVRAWKDDVRLAIDGLAGLTAVDGAAVMSDTYELLAFGAKIRRAGPEAVGKVLVMEAVEGHAPAILDAPELGGTRHLSAAQFVHDQHEAVALVASQDGRFTIFFWSSAEGRVHAHRIETLLL